MRTRAAALVVLALGTLALGACSTSGIDSAAKADLDRRLAALPNSPETYPPAESFIPMAFVPGQWTQHRIVDDKGEPSLLTCKLLGEDGGGYWIETVEDSYHGREIVKMFIMLRGGRDPAAMEIQSVTVKEGKQPAIELEGAALASARTSYRDLLDLVAVTFEPQDKNDFHVPGGRFIGCYEAQTPRPWGPWATPALLCSHPSVPLSGVVHAKAGTTGVMELVAFGLAGAESEL